MTDKRETLVLALGRRDPFIHVDDADQLAGHRSWDPEQVQFFDLSGAELLPVAGTADPADPRAELGDPGLPGFRYADAGAPADPGAVADRLHQTLAVARDRSEGLRLTGQPSWPQPGLGLAETMASIVDPRPEGGGTPHADGFWHNLWHTLWG